MTKLVAFGDSIFAGWDGKENVSANQRIPELIGQQLGWQVTNVAIGGTNAAQAAERLYRTKTSGGRRCNPEADD